MGMIPLHQLIQRAQQGDEDAWDDLYQRFRPMIASEAQKFARHGVVPQDDLEQAGRVGFMKAVQKHDPQRGGFEPWARRHVRWTMGQALGEELCQRARLPASFRKLIPRIFRAKRALRQVGHNPTPEEIAEQSGVSVDEVQAVLRAYVGPVGLEEDLAEEEPPYVEISQTLALRLQALIPVDPLKFLVLAILRAQDYDWQAISQILQDPNPPQGWDCVSTWHPSSCQVCPDIAHWPSVYQAFQSPPPALTPESLRQFFSRIRRSLP
jgi:hypothetical protein